MHFHIEKESTKFLLLLILADFVFIGVHCINMTPILSNSLFSIESDFGYAESFQYIKEFWITTLLFILAIKIRCIVYFFWSLLFMYLMFDDIFQIHEKFGVYLGIFFEFQPMLNLRAQDFGELTASTLNGFLLFTFIGASYLISDNKAKRISKYLFVLVMLLAFFGVVVDMLHFAIPFGKSVLGLIEEGGEMLIMSVIVWFVYGLKSNPENSKRIDDSV